MTLFEEVLPALREGKKAKRLNWISGTLIVKEGRDLRCCHAPCNEEGAIYRAASFDLLADDWEVIDPERELAEKQAKRLGEMIVELEIVIGQKYKPSVIEPLRQAHEYLTAAVERLRSSF